MKVFISGPMSGMRNYNRAAFFKAQEELEKKGYSVWNPAWLAYPSDTEFTKDDMHIIDFAAIRLCDAIYMLKGWKYSKGAREEHEYAAMRGLTIMYEGAWCNEPVFDQEFAYDETIKNRTNYQLEAIKENVKEQYNDIDKRITSFAVSYTVNLTNLRKEVETIKESIGTDNLQEQLDKDFNDVYTEFQSTKDKVNDIEFGYIDWSSKMSSAIDEMEKVKETVKGLNSLVATLGECNGILSDKLDDYKEAYMHLDNADEALERRIKALEKKYDDCTKRMNNFSRELTKFDTTISILVKDNGNMAREHLNDNKVVNNTLSTIDSCLDDLNNRLKAIEKRLDEKDD